MLFNSVANNSLCTLNKLSKIYHKSSSTDLAHQSLNCYNSLGLKEAETMQKVESIIIGGGPCGLSAAIEQKRKGIDTLIIEKGMSLNQYIIILLTKHFSHQVIN